MSEKDREAHRSDAWHKHFIENLANGMSGNPVDDCMDSFNAGYQAATAAKDVEIERLKEMAADALQPFNDAFVQANKWSMPHVQYSEHTAQAVLTGCISAVTLDDFKNAAQACKALAAAQQEG